MAGVDLDTVHAEHRLDFRHNGRASSLDSIGAEYCRRRVHEDSGRGRAIWGRTGGSDAAERVPFLDQRSPRPLATPRLQQNSRLPFAPPASSCLSVGAAPPPTQYLQSGATQPWVKDLRSWGLA
eukprot:scaffold144954_cov33-Tisochrysis_lutea.AAC.2